MTHDTRSASTLAGPTPSAPQDYTATPTTGSPLRIETYRSIEDDQITGGDEMSDLGRGFAQWLSACLSVTPMCNWLAEFREFAREQPREATAISAALVEFLHRAPKETP